MKSRFHKRSIPSADMDRLRMATAVAAEQVLEEHVRSTVELVEQGAARAPVERLLSAYTRLHHLGESESRKLTERVLAALGRLGINSGALHAPRSPFKRLRHRVRGRSNPELREWVERHTARVELTLVDIHVSNTLEILRLVDGHLSTVQAIALYSDMLSLRPTISEMVRLKVLKALQDQESGDVQPLHRDGLHPFRRAENDG